MKKPLGPPYFDPIISGLDGDDTNTETAFGRHVHWGYWHKPDQADASPEQFGFAAEELCKVVCDQAGIQDGISMVDVGCGFGGTIASLNERFSNLDMTGVNIDPRQLARACETVQPREENSIRFVEASANCMPFPDNSFDIVLALESVFHFDRQQFFGEAKRMLVDGGTFTISDFVMADRALQYMNGFDLFGQEEIQLGYGMVDLSYSLDRYRELAKEHGFELCEIVDITENTMPTYDFLLCKSNGMPNSLRNPAFMKATKMLQKACRQRMMNYQILKFEHLPA